MIALDFGILGYLPPEAKGTQLQGTSPKPGTPTLNLTNTHTSPNPKSL